MFDLLCSEDGQGLATGGKGKSLNLFALAEEGILVPESRKSARLGGRIWGIAFKPTIPDDDDEAKCAMAVASGDYKTLLFDKNTLEPALQVIRTRTVRCIDYHPFRSWISVGDGAGYVAIVDYSEEETITEFDVTGRVNVLKFSPKGDYLLVGTDNCVFTLHETKVSQLSNTNRDAALHSHRWNRISK